MNAEKNLNLPIRCTVSRFSFHTKYPAFQLCLVRCKGWIYSQFTHRFKRVASRTHALRFRATARGDSVNIPTVAKDAEGPLRARMLLLIFQHSRWVNFLQRLQPCIVRAYPGFNQAKSMRDNLFVLGFRHSCAPRHKPTRIASISRPVSATGN